MSDLRKAAQLALDALENHTAIKHPQQRAYRDEAIEALRAALQDEGKQEPVASLMTNIQSGDVELVWNDDGFDRAMWHEQPLYTAPPQRPLLTDEEICAAANSVRWSTQYHIDFGRAIERKVRGEEE